MSYKHTGVQNVLSSLELLKAINSSACHDGQLIAVKNVVWSENSVARKFTTVYMWDSQVTAKSLLMDLDGETDVDFPSIAKTWYWNRSVAEYEVFNEGVHMNDYAHLIVIPEDVGAGTDRDYDQPGRWVATDYATFLLHAGFTQWDARADGSLIPKNNAAFDLGDAENKVRHLFLSDNSIWIGEKHRISISDSGELRFQKRKSGKLPEGFMGASSEDITAMKTEAQTASGVDSFGEVDLTLAQWTAVGQDRIDFTHIVDAFQEPDFETVSSLSGDDQAPSSVAWGSISELPTELQNLGDIVRAEDIFAGGDKAGMIDAGKYVNTEYTLPSDVLIAGDIFIGGDKAGKIDTGKYDNTQIGTTDLESLLGDISTPSSWTDIVKTDDIADVLRDSDPMPAAWEAPDVDTSVFVQKDAWNGIFDDDGDGGYTVKTAVVEGFNLQPKGDYVDVSEFTADGLNSLLPDGESFMKTSDGIVNDVAALQDKFGDDGLILGDALPAGIPRDTDAIDTIAGYFTNGKLNVSNAHNDLKNSNQAWSTLSGVPSDLATTGDIPATPTWSTLSGVPSDLATTGDIPDSTAINALIDGNANVQKGVTVNGYFSGGKLKANNINANLKTAVTDLADHAVTYQSVSYNNKSSLSMGGKGLTAFVSDMSDVQAGVTAKSYFNSGGVLSSASRVPNLNASKITAGSFGTGRIPNLNASKITAGSFGTGRIPSLSQSKITDLTTDLGNLSDGINTLDTSLADAESTLASMNTKVNNIQSDITAIDSSYSYVDLDYSAPPERNLGIGDWSDKDLKIITRSVPTAEITSQYNLIGLTVYEYEWKAIANILFGLSGTVTEGFMAEQLEVLYPAPDPENPPTSEADGHIWWHYYTTEEERALGADVHSYYTMYSETILQEEINAAIAKLTS